MRTIIVKLNQSLFDIALQEYGDVQGVFFLVDDNGLNSIDANVYEGDELQVRDEVIDKETKEYLEDHELATVDNVRGKGIGYMRIEKTFKVV